MFNLMSALHLTDYRTSAGQHLSSTYNSFCYNSKAQVAQQVKNLQTKLLQSIWKIKIRTKY